MSAFMTASIGPWSDAAREQTFALHELAPHARVGSNGVASAMCEVARRGLYAEQLVALDSAMPNSRT
jgi:hypothetical protein